MKKEISDFKHISEILAKISPQIVNCCNKNILPAAERQKNDAIHTRGG